MLKFGDIVNIEGGDYVFLLNTGDHCYLARIFNQEESEQMVRGDNSAKDALLVEA